MKQYYICTSEAVHTVGFRFFKSSHYIVLSSGEILVAAEFAAEQAEKIWSSQPSVTALPLTVSGKTVPSSAVNRLSDLSISLGQTTLDVAAAASLIHPEMSCYVS